MLSCSECFTTQWRAHLLHRLERQLALASEPELVAQGDEVLAYPAATLTSIRKTRLKS